MKRFLFFILICANAFGQVSLGDLTEDQTTSFHFHTTSFSAAAPATLTSGVISVVKDGDTVTVKTSAEAYITLDIDWNSITGNSYVEIDTSGDAFFSTGSEYSVVITTGTVDGTSVVGATVAHFSIENRFVVDVSNLDAAVSSRATPTNVTDAHTTTDAAIAALNDPDVAAIVAGVLAGVVDGAIDLETAMKRILSVIVNNATYSGDATIIATNKDSAGTGTVVAHSITSSARTASF